jgi:hypothetical protein
MIAEAGSTHCVYDPESLLRRVRLTAFMPSEVTANKVCVGLSWQCVHAFMGLCVYAFMRL